MTPAGENNFGTRPLIVPEILILASKFDLACDYVVAQLRRCGIAYFRLNSEDLHDLSFVAVPGEPRFRSTRMNSTWKSSRYP